MIGAISSSNLASWSPWAMALKARNEECRSGDEWIIIAQHASLHNNGIVDNHGSRPGPQILVGFVPGSGVPWGRIMGSKMDSALH